MVQRPALLQLLLREDPQQLCDPVLRACRLAPAAAAGQIPRDGSTLVTQLLRDAVHAYRLLLLLLLLLLRSVQQVQLWPQVLPLGMVVRVLLLLLRRRRRRVCGLRSRAVRKHLVVPGVEVPNGRLLWVLRVLPLLEDMSRLPCRGGEASGAPLPSGVRQAADLQQLLLLWLWRNHWAAWLRVTSRDVRQVVRKQRPSTGGCELRRADCCVPTPGALHPGPRL